jgi:hypothetical protein
MKKVQFLGLLAFVFVLASCGKSAVDYNNKLVKIQKEMEPMVLKLSQNMMKMQDSTALPSLIAEANDVQKAAESRVSEINKLTVPSGGEKLQKSFLNQFNFIIDMCKNLKIVGDKTATEAQKTTALTWMTEAEKEGGNLDNELKQEQQNFAKEKGFKIQY